MTEDANSAPGPNTGTRTCLFPPGLGSVQLYHSPAVLDADVQRCAQMGWEVVDMDASGWGAKEQLHSDLASRLNFPSYYGRNLDALDDAMAGLAEGRYGFSVTAKGGSIVLRHFDLFAAANQAAAEAVMEIMTTAAYRALRFGWPLAILIQRDDPDLRPAG